MWEIIQQSLPEIAMGLAGSVVVSETLPFVKKVRANSSAQLIFNIAQTILTSLIKKSVK